MNARALASQAGDRHGTPGAKFHWGVPRPDGKRSPRLSRALSVVESQAVAFGPVASWSG